MGILMTESNTSNNSAFEDRLNKIKMNLTDTNATGAGLLRGEKDFDKLDVSVDTDMQMSERPGGSGDGSDSSDLEWDNEDRKLLSESCDMEFESVKSGQSQSLLEDKEMQVGGNADGGSSSKKQPGKRAKALLK